MNNDWDFEQEVYENYEASEILGDTLEVIKERLMAKVKSDIKAQFTSIREENERLKKDNQKHRDELIIFRKKETELEQKIRNFEKEKQNYSLQDLLKNNASVLYSVDYNIDYREESYTTPSGKIQSERLENDRKFHVLTHKIVSLFVQYPKSVEKRAVFFKYERGDDLWFEATCVDDRIVSTLEEAKSKTRPMFKDEETATLFAEYLQNQYYENKKNKKLDKEQPK